MQIDDFELILLIIIALVFAGFLLWATIKSGMVKAIKKTAEDAPSKIQKKDGPKSEPAVSIFEKFDYMGTKIFHIDGKYTVVEDEVTRNFNSLNELPSRYQKMILEMQTRNFPGKKDSYYMENKNGIYTVVFPDGTRKTYKSYNEIPEKLKKILTGG